MLRQLLRLRSRPYVSPSGETALIIAPHADDETLGCGGLIQRKLHEGASVSVLYVTDGSASHPDHARVSPAELAARRKAEACDALRLLGVGADCLHFLNARDGTLAHLEAAAAAELTGRIAADISRLRPTEVFLPCGDDGSSEHEATFVLVQTALGQLASKPRVLEYPVWSWWSPRLLARHLFRHGQVWRHELGDGVAPKRRALAAYTSQTEPLSPDECASLPAGFLAFFQGTAEYFFERSPDR